MGKYDVLQNDRLLTLSSFYLIKVLQHGVFFSPKIRRVFVKYLTAEILISPAVWGPLVSFEHKNVYWQMVKRKFDFI